MSKRQSFFRFISRKSTVCSLLAVVTFGLVSVAVFANVRAETDGAEVSAVTEIVEAVETVELNASVEVAEVTVDPDKAAVQTTAYIAPIPTVQPVQTAATGCYLPIPYIYIASVDLCMNIVNVGLDNLGNVAVPNNTYQVGRYQHGSSSTIFLDGHSPGSFAAIKGVGYDTDITLNLAGTETIYRVVVAKSVPLGQVDMREALYSYDVTLMTCHGYYDSAIGTYSERFIVYANQI